jgi:hypothetical protein
MRALWLARWERRASGLCPAGKPDAATPACFCGSGHHGAAAWRSADGGSSPHCRRVYGDFAKRGNFSSRQTHGWALDVQISSIGANSEGSSSEGNRIDVNCPLTSLRVNRGDPQSGQKLRVDSMPLLPLTEYVLGVPLTSRSELAMTTPDAKGAPLERWQSLQWQFSMAIGALAHL